MVPQSATIGSSSVLAVLATFLNSGFMSHKGGYMGGGKGLMWALPPVEGKLGEGIFVRYFPTMKLSTSLGFPRMRAARK